MDLTREEYLAEGVRCALEAQRIISECPFIRRLKNTCFSPVQDDSLTPEKRREVFEKE